MPGVGRRVGSLVVGDVASFEFQREVTVVTGVGEGFEAAAEVDFAVADGEIDVAWHGISDVDVRDAGSEPVDEVHRVATGGDDVAEVHHDADLIGDPARQCLCPLDVEAQTVEVQRLRPQPDTRACRDVSGGDEVRRLPGPGLR